MSLMMRAYYNALCNQIQEQFNNGLITEEEYQQKLDELATRITGMD